MCLLMDFVKWTIIFLWVSVSELVRRPFPLQADQSPKTVNSFHQSCDDYLHLSLPAVEARISSSLSYLEELSSDCDAFALFA